MRRTADIGCLSVLPFFETITIIPFSTVTRRMPDMSRTNCSPSRMTSTRRGPGAGGTGVSVGDFVATSASVVPVLPFAVLVFLFRGVRGTRTGRARSGFGVGGFSAASVSFRSLLAAASVSVLPSFAFSDSAFSASSPVPDFGELLRAVSARSRSVSCRSGFSPRFLRSHRRRRVGSLFSLLSFFFHGDFGDRFFDPRADRGDSFDFPVRASRGR